MRILEQLKLEWTDADLQAFRSMWMSRVPIPDIAERLGCSAAEVALLVIDQAEKELIGEWETDSPYDRGKLIDKKELTRATVINGEELLSLDYCIGYFVVTERKIINYCPMCGRKLEVEG